MLPNQVQCVKKIVPSDAFKSSCTGLEIISPVVWKALFSPLLYDIDKGVIISNYLSILILFRSFILSKLNQLFSQF